MLHGRARVHGDEDGVGQVGEDDGESSRWLLTPDFDMCQGRVLQRRKGAASYDRWTWRCGRVPLLKILLTGEEEIDQIF